MTDKQTCILVGGGEATLFPDRLHPLLRAFIWAVDTKYVKSLFFLAIFILLAVGFSSYSFAQTDDTVVVLHTASGNIAIEFFNEDAPQHVDNFITLSSENFYDGTIFHRVISGFMIQGGDPLTKSGAYDSISQWGTGSPGHTVDAEFNDIKHVRGIVSMARSNDPNSAGSQFFIVHADSPHLDGLYTVFGRIITQESFDTLDKIAALETTPPGNTPLEWGKGEILKAEVISKSELQGVLELGEPLRSSSDISYDDQPYRNTRLGIEFMPPTGWLLQEPPKTSSLTPDVVAVIQGTPINPSIAVTIIPSIGQSLDDYIKERIRSLQPLIELGQLEITSSNDLEIHGREGHEISASGELQDGGTTINVMFREFTFYNDGKFYTLSYTTSASDFDNYIEQFDQIMSTFSILPTPTESTPTDTTPDDTIPDDTTPVDTTPTESISVDTTPDDMTQSPSTTDDDNGCLIATATYGSEMAPQVQLLRELRDETVLGTQSGSTFMAGFNQLYYSISPTIADWERQNPAFKEIVKMAITPMLATLAVLNHVEIDSESEMIGYGMGIIALNVGMYLAAPAMIIHRIAKRHPTRHHPPHQEPCTPFPHRGP